MEQQRLVAQEIQDQITHVRLMIDDILKHDPRRVVAGQQSSYRGPETS